MLSTSLIACLELVTVTTYQEGLSNTTVRAQEQFLATSPSYYKTTIEVEQAPLDALASNTVANIASASTTSNSLFTVLDRDSGKADRSEGWEGFACQSVWDRYDEYHHNGDGMNGTLISPTEVLYVKHYAPWSDCDDEPRLISFATENGEIREALGASKVYSTNSWLALVTLAEPIMDIEPAKILSQDEVDGLPDDLQIIIPDFEGKAHMMVRDKIGSSLSIDDNPLYFAWAEPFGIGDSSSGMFLRVGEVTYLIGKTQTISGYGPVVTQEKIDELRELMDELVNGQTPPDEDPPEVPE